ncbi:LRR domain containing protein [Parasponia andersonii]|uniref:LRR domain containing protein n=1 Tax=Parasponia andersonii TaxID=3476 RepID=A0A2P5CDQ6_PARAD|nr:LRR domain containing protein [Parasponia andersonii]
MHIVKGTEAVEGIVLDMSKTRDINFNPEVFQKTYNLRFLKIYGPPNGDKESNVCPYEDLVRIDRLWNGNQPLASLKKIDLSHCRDLAKIPDLSHASNLTTLCLEGCFSLNKFPEHPRNITRLNLGRTSIEEVPSSIGCISCLEIFDLSDCGKLERLPHKHL